MRRLLTLLPALLIATLLVPAAPAFADAWDDPIDLTFPVLGDSYRYMDDYHHSRSRGAHGATDIMAPFGTRIVAAMGGRVSWVSTPASSSCGYCVFVDGDDGRGYNYIHMGPKQSGQTSRAFARSWSRGDRIDRGQLLGFVGCSGNASCGGGEHLHFEIEDSRVRDPYGDARRNPYASLRAADCSRTGVFTDVCDSSVHRNDIERLDASGLTKGCGEDLFCPLQPVSREQMASFLARGLELRAQRDVPFRDVLDSVHRGDIGAIAAEAITYGCSDDRYCPHHDVTRAQMASFLVRALDLPPARDLSAFSDVPRSNVHRADIAALAQAGITKGCGGDRYCPDQPITREQMASFLVRSFL